MYALEARGHALRSSFFFLHAMSPLRLPHWPLSPRHLLSRERRALWALLLLLFETCLALPGLFCLRGEELRLGMEDDFFSALFSLLSCLPLPSPFGWTGLCHFFKNFPMHGMYVFVRKRLEGVLVFILYLPLTCLGESCSLHAALLWGGRRGGQAVPSTHRGSIPWRFHVDVMCLACPL